MAPHPVHPGIDVRRSVRADGSAAETFTVRWKEPDGRKPRRTFDTLEDALDYKAKRRTGRARGGEGRRDRPARRRAAGFDRQASSARSPSRRSGCCR